MVDETSSSTRVAFDLMVMIDQAEGLQRQTGDAAIDNPREHYIRLYNQCLRAARGADPDEILKRKS
jgi:hypothetical protein